MNPFFPRQRGARGKHIAAATMIAITVWLSAAVTCMALMQYISNSPGLAGATPLRWPAQSRIPLDAHGPTLVMFVHPHCPCTRATLGELERIMAQNCPGLGAHVIFVKVAGTPEDWTQTDLWRKAIAIPGVCVHADNKGVEARNFHAETSGITFLYDPRGRLLFEGGITISRGHAGDNPGRSALMALLEHNSSNRIHTPVFGCPLFERTTLEGIATCKK
jgi:hypothetical protein